MMPKGLKNTPRRRGKRSRFSGPDVPISEGEVDVVVVQHDAMWHSVALG